MADENMETLVRAATDQEPLSFRAAFDAALQGKLVAAIDQRKQELSASMFADNAVDASDTSDEDEDFSDEDIDNLLSDEDEDEVIDDADDSEKEDQ